MSYEGEKFNRLTAFEYLGRKRFPGGQSRRMWRFLCDCGGSVVIPLEAAKSGNTKSCGCHKREVLRSGKNGTRHGLTGTPTWNSWQAMLHRCTRPTHHAYPAYGGRGVTVCDRWDPAKGGSFENFLADMGERPAGKSLDKDQLGDGMLYSPETCCWATPTEQARHRKNTAYAQVGGALIRADQLAEIAGISLSAAQQRIHRGLSAEQLFAPASPNGSAARKSTIARQEALV